MKEKAVFFSLLLLLTCLPDVAQAEAVSPFRVTTPDLKMTGLRVTTLRQPKITTPALKMTGVRVTTLRQPKITTPPLKMTGVRVTTLRQPKIATPALKMTGVRVTTLRQPKITTPPLKMTGVRVTALRQPKITTPALKMTGVRVTTLRQSKITTPPLRMTGLAVLGFPSKTPGAEVGQSVTNTTGEQLLTETGNQYAFSIPVELENIPEQVESFKVAVSVVYAGGGIRTLVNEAEKSVRNGRFDDRVSVLIEPAASFSGRGSSYKAALTLCGAGGCVSPLDPGAPSWARPEPGSSPKVIHEGSLTAQMAVDVPTFSMRGKRSDGQVFQDQPARHADTEDLSPQGSDLVDASAGEPRTKSHLKKTQ